MQIVRNMCTLWCDAAQKSPECLPLYCDKYARDVGEGGRPIDVSIPLFSFIHCAPDVLIPCLRRQSILASCHPPAVVSHARVTADNRYPNHLENSHNITARPPFDSLKAGQPHAWFHNCARDDVPEAHRIRTQEKLALTPQEGGAAAFQGS